MTDDDHRDKLKRLFASLPSPNASPAPPSPAPPVQSSVADILNRIRQNQRKARAAPVIVSAQEHRETRGMLWWKREVTALYVKYDRELDDDERQERSAWCHENCAYGWQHCTDTFQERPVVSTFWFGNEADFTLFLTRWK